jgi:hypothetical protein
MSIFFAPSPSSVDYATSAGSAGLATSSTSALNSAQAPNGFIVTGTLSATTVSATTYLNLGNTTAQWNASALQSSPLSATLVPITNQALVYNGSVWTASTIAAGGGGGVTDHGALTGLEDNDHPQYVLSATNNTLSSTVSNHIASASVHFTQAEIDHGGILGLSDNDHPQYVLSSTNNTLSSLVNDHITSASVHFTQAEIDHGSILGLSDNDHPQYVLSATNNALSSTVSNHLASAVHWDLATLNTNYINASGDSVNSAFYFQTVSATTVSAVNYINLPSSVIVWASAGYADLAGSSTLALNATSATSALNATSATSALNATQAPAGFVVTGTTRSTTLSGTTLSVDGGVVKNSFDIASGIYSAPADARLYVQGKSYFQAQMQINNNLYVTGTASATTVSATNYINLPQSDASSLNGYAIDVGSVPLSDGDILAWDTINSYYTIVPSSVFGGGGGIADASSLRGSPLSATLVPTAGQALMYNGSVWTASAALFAYTYGSAVPTGGSDGDIYLQTDVVALQVPSVSATNYYNLPSGTLVWTYATSATESLNATSATSALNAQQAPNGFTVTGLLTTASGDVSAVRMTDYSESKSAPTISSSALTLDLNNSQVFTVSLNSNISTLTISNTDSRANTVQGFTLILTADGTARTISWPASVKWPSGTGPTLTSTNGKVDILSFVSPDNGTTWYGFVGGQNF